jgi:hypothetical protein
LQSARETNQVPVVIGGAYGAIRWAGW